MCVFLPCPAFHLCSFHTYGKVIALFFCIWKRVTAGPLSRCHYFTEIEKKKRYLLGRVGFWPGLCQGRVSILSGWMNCWIPRYHRVQENIWLTAGCLHMSVSNSATWNPFYKAGMLRKFKDFIVGIYCILTELPPNLKKIKTAAHASD